MTDHANAELIAGARQLIRHSSVSVPEHANMLGRLADALEAAEQRADLADADLDVELDKNAAYREKNDQLAAVVEKVLSHDPLHGADSGLHCGGMAPCIRDILATAPADALREHDAAIIERLADEFAARLPDGTGNGRVYNSHTIARMLREKARQRREEAGAVTRRLWIDTKGQPVITTTPNGVSNATRWGWTPAVAVASEQADAIDRMGPAAGCAYCVGAGGYEDYDGEWRECSCQQAGREPSGADFNRAAQTFYEASGLNLPHTSKPEVVAGVRAAWSALIAAQGVRDVT